jgi:hypothetical protein
LPSDRPTAWETILSGVGSAVSVKRIEIALVLVDNPILLIQSCGMSVICCGRGYGNLVTWKDQLGFPQSF